MQFTTMALAKDTAIVTEPEVGSAYVRCSSMDKCIPTQCMTEYSKQESLDGSESTFSGQLQVDHSIHLSRKNFKESIKALIKNTDLLDTDKIFFLPTYPKPGILAQFAERSYRVKEAKYDRDYEKKLDLPSGWKLLTIASNTALSNGYFGTAFWHPEYHQVVISHRGTDPTNLGAIYTDFKGVVYNEYASQMNSATTFTFIISNVLDILNKELGVHFELFITGHSLGGWLAQVTTCTAKYLKVIEDGFQKCLGSEEGYHCHACVFDTPGCKDTLLQMQKDFQILNKDESAFLDSLDITSYLSAPNRVNTCNSHTGTIYRLFPNLSHMSKLEEVTPLYNIITHRIDNILEVFDPESGNILRDEFGSFRAHQVLDWPLSSGLDGGEEYILFFKWAKFGNNYHPKQEKKDIQNDNYETVRYLDKSCSLSIFTQTEVQFLERYIMLRKLPNLFTPENFFDFIQDGNAVRHLCHMLKTFHIENKVIRCNQAQELQKFIPFVKRLLHFFPTVQCKAVHTMSSFDVMKNIFNSASRHYISSLNEIMDLQVNHEWEKSVLEGFLCSGNRNEQICCLTFDTQCSTRISLGVMYKAFTLLENNAYHNCHLALGLDWILHQEQHVCMSSFLDSEHITDHLLLIDTEQLPEFKCEYAAKLYFEKLFRILSVKPGIKVLLFATRNDTIVQTIMDVGNKFPVANYRTIRRDGKMLLWEDLKVSSKQNIWEKKVVTFQGQEQISLAELLRSDYVNTAREISLNDVIDPNTLAKLINNKEVKVCKALPSFEDNYYIERSFECNAVSVREDILRDEDISDVFLLNSPDEVDISNVVDLYKNSKKVIKFESIENYNGSVDFNIVLVRKEEVKRGFSYLCNNVNTHPIHVLSKQHDSLLWHMSCGSTYNIAKYKVGCESSSEICDENSLIKDRGSKVIIISGKPRIGKSAILTQVATKIKKSSPLLWVVKIDLQGAFQKLTLKDIDFETLSLEQAVDLVWRMHTNKKNTFEERLFKSCIYLPLNVVILLDSLSEVSFPFQENAVKLIKVLRSSNSVAQMWITTNESLKEQLEMEFGTVAYNIIPFSEGDQIKFFHDFWKCKLNLDDVDRGRFDILAETIMNLLPSSMQEPTLDLTKLMLHIKMLAEVFADEFKKSSTYETVPDIPDKLNLAELYKMFIYKKFQSYFGKIVCDGDAVKIQMREDAKEMLYKSFTVNPEYSALYTLFEESSIYKFFEGSRVLTLFNRTKGVTDVEVQK